MHPPDALDPGKKQHDDLQWVSVANEFGANLSSGDQRVAGASVNYIRSSKNLALIAPGTTRQPFSCATDPAAQYSGVATMLLDQDSTLSLDAACSQT